MYLTFTLLLHKMFGFICSIQYYQSNNRCTLNTELNECTKIFFYQSRMSLVVRFDKQHVIFHLILIQFFKIQFEDRLSSRVFIFH